MSELIRQIDQRGGETMVVSLPKMARVSLRIRRQDGMEENNHRECQGSGQISASDPPINTGGSGPTMTLKDMDLYISTMLNEYAEVTSCPAIHQYNLPPQVICRFIIPYPSLPVYRPASPDPMDMTSLGCVNVKQCCQLLERSNQHLQICE